MHSIEVNNLSKKYQLGLTHRGSLRDLMDATVRRFSPNRRRADAAPSGEFWALKDVSFDVAPGEVLGIIGNNGAGKSTLLKILSRITAPTTGQVRMRGRVASLLEVGTGFHPELTGRENIFLNAAILGMCKREIRSKFDEIVDFSDVEEFLDTPVKRYSSGMYTRLAFAVAAHLEPEILAVDEVLAVGDAAFQTKCLSRMDEVARHGRTVLFVSHNMNAVARLCRRALLLVDGQVKRLDDDVSGVIDQYLGNGVADQHAAWNNKGQEFANPFFQPLRFWLADESGEPLQMPVSNHAPMHFMVEGDVQRLAGEMTIGYTLLDGQGRTLYWSCLTDTPPDDWPALSVGRCQLASVIPPRFLNEGEYRLELCVKLPGREWICRPTANAPSIAFQIRGGLSGSPRWVAKRPGMLAPVFPWYRTACAAACKTDFDCSTLLPAVSE